MAIKVCEFLQFATHLHYLNARGYSVYFKFLCSSLSYCSVVKDKTVLKRALNVVNLPLTRHVTFHFPFVWKLSFRNGFEFYRPIVFFINFSSQLGMIHSICFSQRAKHERLIVSDTVQPLLLIFTGICVWHCWVFNLFEHTCHHLYQTSSNHLLVFMFINVSLDRYSWGILQNCMDTSLLKSDLFLKKLPL